RAYQPLQRALNSPLCFSQFACALLNGSLQFVRVAPERQLLLLRLVPQGGYLDRPPQRGNQILPVDGLLNEIVGSAAQGINRQRVVAVPSDHQGGRVGPPCPDLTQQRETVCPRHLDVGDDRVVFHAGDELESGPPGVGCVHRHALNAQPEALGKRLQQGGVVVDDEHARRVFHSRLTEEEVSVSAGVNGRRMMKVAPSL